MNSKSTEEQHSNYFYFWTFTVLWERESQLSLCRHFVGGGGGGGGQGLKENVYQAHHIEVKVQNMLRLIFLLLFRRIN